MHTWRPEVVHQDEGRFDDVRFVGQFTTLRQIQKLWKVRIKGSIMSYSITGGTD